MKIYSRLVMILCTLAFMSGFNSCKDDDDVTLPTDYEQTPEKGTAKGGVLGMYLLNEGNMGSNKCTLDFLDFSTGLYARNIYPEKNPEVVLELGDVGNDEIIYDGRLFISVSGSNKMEVLDARSARRIGKVDVSNSRMLAAGDGHVYVGSYTGAIQVDPSVKAGVVYKVDARTLTVVDSYSTPYWPEGMAYIDGKLYVATSGTAIAGDYPSNDILVIDPLDMSLESTISVGPNLNKLKADSKGRLWVSSRGDYMNKPSRLYCVVPGTSPQVNVIAVACTDFDFYKDNLYYYSSEWNNATYSMTYTYGKVGLETLSPAGNFLSVDAQAELTVPYGIAINPVSGDIYISDAKNYTSSGALFCFSNAGVKKWSVKTGDIPGHMVFLRK